MKNALLLFLVLVFVKTFSQDEGHWTDKVESPVVIVKNDNAKLDLSSTKVDAKIVGVIADVTITQTYKNSGEEDVDASYLFPGSSKSAVYGMIMKVGDKTIKAKIKEKEKAKEEFEKAKAEGKKASLMQQHRPNVFQMDLANIPAGDQMEITIQYTEILIPEDGDYEFVFPTIVGPRFANPEDVLAEPWIAQSNQEPEQVLKNGNIQINVDIDAPLPLTQVKNRTHSSKITKSGKEAHISHVIDKAKELKDFIVSFRLKGDEIQTGISTFEGKDENFFLFMMESPDREKIVMVPPREYIFIIDVSGSMGGFPITVTKELMENLMKGMHVQDRFNVLLFAGDSDFLSEESLPATDKNLKKAIKLINNQSGQGSTQLLPAMERALKYPKLEGFSRNFVIVSDGFVSVEKATFDLIKNNLGDANFFSFGIGPSVNRYIMDGIAHVGGGEAFIATNEKEARQKAKKFLKYIDQPSLTDIRIDFEDWEVYDVIPERQPDLFSAKPLVVFGKFKGAPKGNVKIMGKLGGEKYKNSVALEPNTDGDRSALRYLWARHRIQELSDYEKVSPQTQRAEEIKTLGLQYNLLTDYTAFVAIDESLPTAQQEMKNVSKGSGSVPEPHEWAMIILLGATVVVTLIRLRAFS